MDRKETVNVKTLYQLERVRKRDRKEALLDEKIQKQISYKKTSFKRKRQGPQ